MQYSRVDSPLREEPAVAADGSEFVTTNGNDDEDDEPDWLRDAADDAFTPTLLDTLQRLDEETDALGTTLSHMPMPAAAEDEPEPEWLARAAEAAKQHIIETTEHELDWDDEAAAVQERFIVYNPRSDSNHPPCLPMFMLLMCAIDRRMHVLTAPATTTR